MYSVYIIDDEIMALNDIINMIPLIEHGFELIGSNTDAQTALAEIIERKPDIVFTDLKMPVYDGIELIARIREHGLHTEFIMLSAFDEFDACRSFYRRGGFDYLLKPLDQWNVALVLERLSRKIALKRNQTPSILFTPSHSQSFDDLVAYVIKHFNKKHTLEKLSELFNMNPTYICDLFASQYQSTLTIFITNLRMKEASRLIIENKAALKEIALHCGYPNYQYFCKVFKQHFGKSPAQFRDGKG